MDTAGVLELSWIRSAYERKRNGAGGHGFRRGLVGPGRNRLVAQRHPIHHSIRATCALPFSDFPLQVAGAAGPGRRLDQRIFSPWSGGLESGVFGVGAASARVQLAGTPHSVRGVADREALVVAA